ncbi:MAG: DUF177 domain-containing protein [candidate division KSB1 bacterium]|nr:DUF177 domain-containing protein [candidate division KSB1 bacterium]MDZ7346919.1 DUF177 domain-containing protein [candidate division KSB1 bacterium]
MIRFFLSRIKEGHSEFEEQVSPFDIELLKEDGFTSPVDIFYLVDKVGEEIFVKTRLRTRVELVCDRCLEPYVLALDETISSIMTPDEKLAARNDEDIYLIAKTTNEVDITEAVRDTLLLAIPYKKLCHVDCKGLCPHCGANLNLTQCTCGDNYRDPRWEALSKLKFD